MNKNINEDCRKEMQINKDGNIPGNKNGDWRSDMCKFLNMDNKGFVRVSRAAKLLPKIKFKGIFDEEKS